MGPSQISDAPLSISFKVISFWTLISVNCIGLGSQGHVLLRKCSSWYPWSGQGIRRSGRQVPVNMFVSLAAFTSLPCMFSLTLHLNFRHVDCLSAEFISPLLLFSEASLWQIIVVAEECFHWDECELALFRLPLCWLQFRTAVVWWSCFPTKYYSINRPNLENYEVNFSDA